MTEPTAASHNDLLADRGARHLIARRDAHRGRRGAALSQFTTPMLIVRKSATGSLQGRRILVASDGDEDSDRIEELAGGWDTARERK
jgi:hypothetical protein